MSGPNPRPPRGATRREFLAGSTALGLGLGLGRLAPLARAAPATTVSIGRCDSYSNAELVASLDRAALELRKTRAEVVRAAIEHYLAEYEDLSIAVARLRDPADPVLDWEEVRGELLESDQAQQPRDR